MRDFNSYPCRTHLEPGPFGTLCPCFIATAFFVLGLCSCLFAEQARESAADFDILHRTVDIDNAKYETIITKPKAAGRYPAVPLIAGLGCYSLDHLKPDDPYARLLYGLTRQGYVTMRVEKNDEGESKGPPRDSPRSDLHLAVRRSLAGLHSLASSEFVDPYNIFILAHSIGPLEGVFVAQKFPVRGGIHLLLAATFAPLLMQLLLI
jgi:hypothetical protein